MPQPLYRFIKATCKKPVPVKHVTPIGNLRLFDGELPEGKTYGYKGQEVFILPLGRHLVFIKEDEIVFDASLKAVKALYQSVRRFGKVVWKGQESSYWLWYRKIMKRKALEFRSKGFFK